MPERTDWEQKARSLLRVEMTRQNVTYAQLVERLADIGVSDSERNVRNKVSRGKFTASFMLACMEAMGAKSLRLADD